jgi:hypothetical protein
MSFAASHLPKVLAIFGAASLKGTICGMNSRRISCWLNFISTRALRNEVPNALVCATDFLVRAIKSTQDRSYIDEK